MSGCALRVFPFEKETRHADMYPNLLGYISDTYECAHALCLEAVDERGTPPYNCLDVVV